MTDEQYKELVKLLKKNIELSEVAAHTSKGIRRHQIVMSIWSWIKIGIIVLVIVWAAVSIPKYIQGQINGFKAGFTSGDPDVILEQFGIENFSPSAVLERFKSDGEAAE